jgi:hypothetical protein
MQKVVAVFRASRYNQRPLLHEPLHMFVNGLPGYVKGFNSKASDVTRVAFHIIENKLTDIFASFSNSNHISLYVQPIECMQPYRKRL